MTTNLSKIPNDCKCVYFIKSGHFLKIGIASQLRTRFKAIKTDCQEECELIGYIKSEEHRKIEKEIHDSFPQFNYRAEWFFDSRDFRNSLVKKYKRAIISLSSDFRYHDEEDLARSFLDMAERQKEMMILEGRYA